MLKLQPKGRQIEWFPCRGTIDKTAVWGLYCMYAIVGLMYLWRKYRRVFQNIVNAFDMLWHMLFCFVTHFHIFSGFDGTC